MTPSRPRRRARGQVVKGISSLSGGPLRMHDCEHGMDDWKVKCLRSCPERATRKGNGLNFTIRSDQCVHQTDPEIPFTQFAPAHRVCTLRFLTASLSTSFDATAWWRRERDHCTSITLPHSLAHGNQGNLDERASDQDKCRSRRGIELCLGGFICATFS
jgi:hypothetical protein